MDWDGGDYQARFDALEAQGIAVHGEADLVMTFGPGSVLDAGCGTGRVGAELHRRGVDVVGIDADPSMIETARARHPGLTWELGDVASLDLGRRFDIVVMAGNVPLFTPAGTQAALVAGCARHLGDGAALIAGFQLGRGYELDRYDIDATAAGLELVDRWATWDRDPFTADAAYAVSVHRAAVT
jgi:SAM-dependent methyltransferase